MVIRHTEHDEFYDDLTGETGDDVRTFKFAIGGITYEIEACLNTRNEIREILSRFVSVARPRVLPSGHDTAVIREWALREGYSVSNGGRLPDGIIMEYYLHNP